MDLKKQTKPIHLRCPNCGHDFSYNSRHIENEYDRVKEQIKFMKVRLSEMNEERVPKNAPERKRIQAKLDNAALELQQIKRSRKAVSESIQANLEKNFRLKVKALIGDEKYIQLRKECEDDLTYNIYDMAFQNHNNFNNV